MTDVPRNPMSAVLYAMHLPRLREVAREHGYALALHGSMTRDLDLIAVPWTEDARHADDLAEAVAEELGGTMTAEALQDKPHGRVAYTIVLGSHAFVDLSVTPREVDR